MPFCPKCHDEFREDAETCPDCAASLVSSLPVKKIPKEAIKRMNEPLVWAATAPNEALGTFWQGILEDAGVRSVLKSDNFKSAQYVLWLNQSCEIWVLKSDLRKARELIKPLSAKLKGYPNYGMQLTELPNRGMGFILLGASLLFSVIFGLLGSAIVLWFRLRLARKTK